MLHVLQGRRDHGKEKRGDVVDGVTVRSGKAQGAEPQNGGGMTTRSRGNGYERQCNMLHGGAT